MFPFSTLVQGHEAGRRKTTEFIQHRVLCLQALMYLTLGQEIPLAVYVGSCWVDDVVANIPFI